MGACKIPTAKLSAALTRCCSSPAEVSYHSDRAKPHDSNPIFLYLEDGASIVKGSCQPV